MSSTHDQRRELERFIAGSLKDEWQLQSSANRSRAASDRDDSRTHSPTHGHPHGSGRFPGTIEVVEAYGLDSLNACARLKRHIERDGLRAFGLDMEWIPDPKGGQSPIALIQTSTEDYCVLWRICCMRTLEGRVELPYPLLSLMQDPTVTKVGCGIQQDVAKLRAMFGWQFHGHDPASYVDVQELYAEKHPKRGRGPGNRASLSDMSDHLLGFRVAELGELMGLGPKEAWTAFQRWTDPTLTEPQKSYASTDAWAALQVWKKLKQA
eukprot:tig00020807_g14057.t1